MVTSTPKHSKRSWLLAIISWETARGNCISQRPPVPSMTVVIPLWYVERWHSWNGWSSALMCKRLCTIQLCRVVLLCFLLCAFLVAGWQGPNPASYWAPWSPMKASAFSFLVDGNLICCMLWCCFGYGNKTIFKGHRAVRFRKAVLRKWISLYFSQLILEIYFFLLWSSYFDFFFFFF